MKGAYYHRRTKNQIIRIIYREVYINLIRKRGVY